MLTREENELMSRTDKGTPMGEFCRRFWTPVLLSEELPEPDCAPVQTKIYGEELVAFRTTSGKVGLLKEFCPHRHASLFYGRNEEEGLRCAYHGWKFDIEGQCVDMMSEPAESNFANKVTTTAYPTQEGAGFIWAYMGPPELQPPMPELEYLHVPENQRQTNKVFYESNFVQVIEGEIDTVHASILHSRLDSLDKSDSATSLAGRYSFRDRAARFHVEDT
ncbi:MAG: Rieske 2Fe-2S domain-containing protein, partial [Chloroflexi bacterium]|nr:Rieske 2Fe-2S domain-containing protein [Chloroflexota bacterium]